MRALCLLAMAATARGHGAIVSPRSRNSIDYLANVRARLAGALCFGSLCTLCVFFRQPPRISRAVDR